MSDAKICGIAAATTAASIGPIPSMPIRHTIGTMMITITIPIIPTVPTNRKNRCTVP